MGNFASSGEWLNSDDIIGHREIITPISTSTMLPTTSTKPATEESTGDLVALLVSRAVTTCKQSVHQVFSRAVGTFHGPTDNIDDMDDIFDEFQIVYEDNYERIKENKKRTSENDMFKTAPWFQYSPSDFQTISTESVGKWKQSKPMDDDDDRSATTESTDWLSDSDDKSENPASSCSSSCASDLDDMEFFNDDDDLETKASCLLRLASTYPEDVILFVEDYLCKCGNCPQYKLIEDDVSRIVTWRDPEELISISRILQAFSTYNEAIGYHPDMIAAVDECLRIWGGDEDQAFSSFVVIQDEVPYLCANIV